jgi:glycogen debranching enzyme
MVILNQLNETIIFENGTEVRLTGEERVSCQIQMHGNCYLTEFFLEKRLPIWRYQANETLFEKRLFLRHYQNTVQITYKYISGNKPLTLQLHPNVHFRQHHEPVNVKLPTPYVLTIAQDYYELSEQANTPSLKILFCGPNVNFSVSGNRIEEFIYREE